jgi:hypothetical protein
VSNAARSISPIAVHATDDGSFTAVLPSQPGDELTIESLVDGVSEGYRTIEVEWPSAAAYTGADEIDTGINVQEPGAGAVAVRATDAATVEVSGAVNVLSPGLLVVVANADQGFAATAAVATDGSFALSITAANGDRLEILIVEPASSNAAPASRSVIVP